jgi:hypothetical protein
MLNRPVTLPPDKASEMKFCKPEQILEALDQGLLTRRSTKNGGIVAWDERFDAWNAPLGSTELRDYINSTRYASKTMWPGHRWQMEKVAQGFQRTWRGSSAMVVPVNLGNMDLLVLSQDGYHDGNVCTPETMDEIRADLIEGDGIGVYQIVIRISPKDFTQGMYPSSECMTVFDAANDLRLSRPEVVALGLAGKLTAARYEGHLVVFRDGLYRRVKRETLEQSIKHAGDGSGTVDAPALRPGRAGLQGASGYDTGLT